MILYKLCGTNTSASGGASESSIVIIAGRPRLSRESGMLLTMMGKSTHRRWLIYDQVQGR